VNVKPDSPTRRIAIAFVISLLLHGLIMWGTRIRLPNFKPSLPPLTAKLEALPTADRAKPKPKRQTRPPIPKPVPEAAAQVDPVPQDVPLAASEVIAASAPVAASEVKAASAPVQTDTLAATNDKAVERPPLPKSARLTFNVLTGGGLLVGEAIHTLEIDDGHYVLHSVMKTVGLAKLFKSFELTQNSSGSYSRSGLQPEWFIEERSENSSTKRYTAEFDHTTHFARFSTDREMELPPDTQDILSIMYQFPPLQGIEIANVSVSNGKKIEQYQFEIFTDETIDTALGKLLTVHLHKIRGPNEEGLDIWLAQEYRLFPVRIEHFDRNGEVDLEAIITDIRVSEEEGVRKDVAN
jgi:hypothetical protein